MHPCILLHLRPFGVNKQDRAVHPSAVADANGAYKHHRAQLTARSLT